jgi:hypothetical protein
MTPIFLAVRSVVWPLNFLHVFDSILDILSVRRLDCKWIYGRSATKEKLICFIFFDFMFAISLSSVTCDFRRQWSRFVSYFHFEPLCYICRFNTGLQFVHVPTLLKNHNTVIMVLFSLQSSVCMPVLILKIFFIGGWGGDVRFCLLPWTKCLVF